jgi:galactose-1-phosphate uridylyltransferase
MNFVPQSALPDIWCVFPQHDSLIRLGQKELAGFLDGLARVLQYFNGEKLYSFNMSMYSERENDMFRLNARICPRLLLREIGNSDHTYYQHILKEPTSIISPESACKKLKTFFD